MSGSEIVWPHRRDALTARGVAPERIFNSRNRVAFYAGVMAATDGRGVDVVFNGLSGPSMEATLRLLADNGSPVDASIATL